MDGLEMVNDLDDLGVPNFEPHILTVLMPGIVTAPLPAGPLPLQRPAADFYG